MYHILFVCMGNICRSPTAHAVMRHLLGDAKLLPCVRVDSAGTHAYHLDAAPDVRSQHHASARGYDLSDLRARQIQSQDFQQADLILAMDWNNLALLQAQCPPDTAHKVRRMAEFFQHHPDTVVPDPYEDGPAGFEKVIDLIEDGCQGLLQHLLAPAALSRCLPHWRRLDERSALEREFEFSSFVDAMAFVQRVAVHAEAHQHHPEIWNVYHRVRMTLTTHDANGLTLKDLALANAIDQAWSPVR
jgi:protein-tyrosine phosphatase